MNEKQQAAKLYLVLWKAFRAVEALDKQNVKDLGFSNLSDFAVLEVLYSKGSLPINTIGKTVLLTSGSITAAIDRMEKRGFVSREHSQEDRRVVFAHLTDEGREMIASILDRHFEELVRITGGLNREEKDQLISLLKKLGIHAAELGE